MEHVIVALIPSVIFGILCSIVAGHNNRGQVFWGIMGGHPYHVCADSVDIFE